VENAVRSMRLAILAGLSALALQALATPSATAQSAQASTPPSFAPPPKPTSTPAVSAPAPAAAAAKPSTQAAVPIPTPKPDPASTSALPTTHVVAGANPAQSGGRMLNPYSEQAETKYIKIPVSSIGCNAARAPGKPYFVEFRARGALSFGHTFVLYGKLGEGNRFASYKIAGLHPKGGSQEYTMGLWFPVAAETGPSDGDVDEQFLAARYCVTLTEAEFKQLVPYIQKLQVEHKTWHGTTYNCNSFGMDVAKFIGLDAPNPNASLPKDLIEKLAEMNKNRPRHPMTVSSDTGGLFSSIRR
jgi:hypothetical protein